MIQTHLTLNQFSPINRFTKKYITLNQININDRYSYQIDNIHMMIVSINKYGYYHKPKNQISYR